MLIETRAPQMVIEFSFRPQIYFPGAATIGLLCIYSKYPVTSSFIDTNSENLSFKERVKIDQEIFLVIFFFFQFLLEYQVQS